VLYCIREAEEAEKNMLISGKGVSARKMYEIGAMQVEEKTKKHWIFTIK
jgi:hypothetical protein